MKQSKKFEKQIQRIHNLIEQSGSEITWDDRIPDPDNPKQPRQIDITIKRKGKLTIIECRIHKVKQDVKWIEEMIGRRVSLNANAAIAVSASGFTTGAIKKAKAFGIILRDFLTLTEQEIQHWGHNSKVWLTFYQYNDTQLAFTFPRTAKYKLTPAKVLQFIKEKGRIFGIFQSVAKIISEENPQNKPCTFNVTLSDFEFDIYGEKILQIDLDTNFRSIKKIVNIPPVVAYGSPDTKKIDRDIMVEDVDLGEFEIMQSTNTVSVVIDLSPIKNPPNSQFRYVLFDFKRQVKLKSVDMIGIPPMQIDFSGLQISIKFV